MVPAARGSRQSAARLRFSAHEASICTSPGRSARSRFRRGSSSRRWRRERPGVPPPGPPLRRRARLLGDGRAAPGLHHRNERTLGYLRIACDERPLAVQIFGSEPRADGRGGAHGRGGRRRHRRHQLRLPGAQGDEDRRGRDAARRSRRAPARIVDAVAGAVDVPVSVKMRRGLENGSRTCLEVGPRLVEAGAASLTLHPRSARADVHGHGRPLAHRGARRARRRPGVASGDVTSRARAQAVLATTGAAAVMVGRAAQGNPWALREMLDGDAREPSPRGGRRRADPVRPRDRPRARRAARRRLPEEVLRLVSRPRPLPEAVQAGAASSSTRPTRSSTRLLAAAPGARRARAPRGETLPAATRSCSTLPISIYGGG